MPVNARIPKPARSLLGLLRQAGQGLLWWSTSGALSLQVLAVGAGCVLAALLSHGPDDRFPAILLPVIFIVAVRPEVQRVLLPHFHRPRRKRTTAVGSQKKTPFSELSARPSPGRIREANIGPSEATFLRSFDRLEEILQEALILQVGEIAQEFMLRDKVGHLAETGFLTAVDRDVWADALAVRRRLLLTGAGRRGPTRVAVEGALAKMLQLQTTLIDRRRLLFDQEQSIRRQEEGALHGHADRHHTESAPRRSAP